MIIRPEVTKDIDAITNVTRAAFENHPVSHQTEHFIIKEMRRSGVLSLSLVAEIGGDLCGHIAFSPAIMPDDSKGWYALGPISVLPPCQKEGIGSALMEEGLKRLKAMDAKGCALVGDPGYYTRFGFKNAPGLIYDDIPQEFFMVLPFCDDIPKGSIRFDKAFLATK